MSAAKSAAPRTMRAAVLAELGKPLVLADVELPSELQTGQVLVRVHYSGICGSQLGEIEGVKGEDKYLPHLLGHEGSATVLEIGPGVSHAKPGDLVVLHWRKGQGMEAEPPRYQWNGRKLNGGWVTTFNELAIISENRMTVIPPKTDKKIAALFGCAVTTGFGVVANNARIQLEESVVVYGAGGVGLNIVQAAALAGAEPVIAVDLYDNRLELARKMGATHLINASATDAETAIRAALGTLGLDCFIDNTGQPPVIELGYRMTHERGRVILVGVPRKGANINIFSLPLHFGKTISGSHGGEAVPHEDIPKYLAMLSSGRISLSELITDVYPLADINRAISEIRSGVSAGRVLVQMGAE